MRVAISGMGCLCGVGGSLPECIETLFQGMRYPRPPTGFAAPLSTEHPVFLAPAGFFPEKRFNDLAVSRCRTVRLSLTASLEALDDAGLDRKAAERVRVGVSLGTNVVGSVNNEGLFGPESGNSRFTLAERFVASNPAGAIAAAFGLSGPLQIVATACSAGGDAIGIGAAWIRQGLCDVVVAGGADEMYEITYNGFISLMNYDRSPCRPFDADRQGLNLGEGAAIMVLESDAHLRKRGKRPRGFVLGYGSASDAYHLTAPSPDGIGLQLAIKEAMGEHPFQSVAFINTHGTGTPDNDRVEAGVIAEMFPKTPFLSTKGYTGHTLGGAGAVEAVFTLAALEAGRIPASIGFENPDPDLSVFPVSENTEIRGSTAISQTLAFGGINSVLLLGIPEGHRK